MLRFNLPWLLIIPLALALFACEVERCEEKVPQIGFERFDRIDSIRANMIISFKDCDGDIGLSPSDTAPPFEYNLFLEYYHLKNGEWIFRNLSSDTAKALNLSPFYYRVQEIENKSSSDILEGEIEVALNGYNLEAGDTLRPDTIKFEIKLLDRALNESNIAETDPIIIP